MDIAELLNRSHLGALHPFGIIPGERRRRTRAAVHWACQVIDASGFVAHSATENLSSRGFYCLADGSFTPGDLLACILYLPRRASDGAGLHILECTVRVVHVQTSGEQQGVGFEIEEYNLNPRHGAATS